MSMGLYIKNMEMPKEGSWTTVRIYSDGTCAVPNRQGDCTLIKGTKAVPVPPHGRLGDLDKLIEKIDGIWDCNDMVFKPDDHCCNVPEDCKGCKWAQTKDCIQRMVENAPTIIPASEEGET